jgi:hypothetical protein
MRIRKIIYVLTAVCGTAVTPSSSFGQSDTPRKAQIAVHISSSKKTVKVGESIHVEVLVSNNADAPILIANSVGTITGALARVQFELTDSHGHISPPVMTMIADDFEPTKPSDDDAATKLLCSWTVLYPHTSMLFDVPIEGFMFKFLSRPGRYTLSATYASNGILYGRNSLGLSNKLLTSLPYTSWTGKVSTNEIPVTLVSANKAKE